MSPLFPASSVCRNQVKTLEQNMDKEFAQKFGEEWVSAWNSRDLNKILSHYTNDFEMESPVIQQLVGVPTGVLKGKEAVRAYWSKALEMHPELHFKLINVFIGGNSVLVQYQGHRGLSAEMFYFDGSGKVIKAYAHYK